MGEATAPLRNVELWDPKVEIERRADGTILARSPEKLPPYPDRFTERLVHFAQTAPERTFVAKRVNGGDWRHVTYAQSLDAARRIGQALIDRKLSPERPLVVLSGNDLEHAMLALGALHVGVPYAPVSPAYSLVSTDYDKLKHIIRLLTPGLVYVSSGKAFAKALAAALPADVEIVVGSDPIEGRACTLYADLVATEPTAAVDAAHLAVGPDTIAKFLFTSGSTGKLPKGVINTHRLWASNMAVQGHVFTFLQNEPPVLVDWLPWNHTFGGNGNFGMALYFGGTLYIDEGKPVPHGMDETIRNLREIAPTIYLNVPKGFEVLVQHMRAEPDLCKTFFSRLKSTFFAGAGLAQHVWDELDALAVETVGERIIMMSGLGATETGPSALFCHPALTRSGAVGLPVPQCTLKLVPNAGKLELRVKGPSITTGYWREPELTKNAFDDQGFYCMGDALKFVDPEEPSKGFAFDGRVSEDFKLATGTWVSVGPLRAKLVAAMAPLVRDAVVAGYERDDLGIILIPDLEACQAFLGHTGKPDWEKIVSDERLLEVIAARLRDYDRTTTGSSTRVMSAVFLDTPPSLDAGEITDKGSINQRAVLAARGALVESLYASTPPKGVISVVQREVV